MEKLGIVLRRTHRLFENKGVLNPAVIEVDGKIHLFYRAISSSGISTIGRCILSNAKDVAWRSEYPVLWPEFDYEKKGLEDPRLVCIEGLFYLTYTAYDGNNALGALAISSDLINWKKFGVIVPRITLIQYKQLRSKKPLLFNEFCFVQRVQMIPIQLHALLYLWDKNLVFFPRKIRGKFCFLHRIKPDIQIVMIKKLENLTEVFWKNYLEHLASHVVISPKYEHEINYVGGGCPPIETPSGWILIYHGVSGKEGEFVYSVGVSLLRLDDPSVEIARLRKPLFIPALDWETEGIVANVCFPTGAIVVKGELNIYYGAADERIAVFSMPLSDLLLELSMNKVQ
jgi:predicted GH43/DUF377 family glycosyl hydrolase